MKVCRNFYTPEAPTCIAGVKPRKLIDEFYSWLGFGACLHPDMDDLDEIGPDGFFHLHGRKFAPGYIATVSIIHLDWRDRVRAFLSGKLYHVAAMKTDVLINTSLARSKISVLPPNWRP